MAQDPVRDVLIAARLAAPEKAAQLIAKERGAILSLIPIAAHRRCLRAQSPDSLSPPR